MCFSIFHAPRFRYFTPATSWWESFHKLNKNRGNSSSFKLLGSYTYDGHEGGYSRRWIRRPATTKTEGRSKSTLSSKTSNIRHEVSDGTISTNTTLHINKSETSEIQRIQYCDIQQKIAENKDLCSLITFIVFDIETTGFSRENDRIIEIAIRFLLGGENSTFQTLVNPGRYVPNTHIHGISTHMVNRPGIPRMEEVIPILLQYVRSRLKPGGIPVFIAHNARSFDVPFLTKEFERCSFEIPPDWLFLDTLPLAREMMKLGGSKISPKTTLQALREHYGIQLVGPAHRAMSDVEALSLILQRLTFDLKLPASGLFERTFRASDPKKKKNSV